MRVLLIVGLLISLSAFAFDKPDKGWFFYEDPEKPKKDKTIKKVEKNIEKPKKEKKEKPKKVEKTKLKQP